MPTPGAVRSLLPAPAIIVGVARDGGSGFRLNEVDLVARRGNGRTPGSRGRLAADADLALVTGGPPRASRAAPSGRWHRCARRARQSASSSRSTAQRQLRQVIRADREAVEDLAELVGKDDVRRNLGHHIDLQSVAPRWQPSAAMTSSTCCPSSTVRQKGTITIRLVRPNCVAHAADGRDLEHEALAVVGMVVTTWPRASRSWGSPRVGSKR